MTIEPVCYSTTSRRLKRLMVNWKTFRDLFTAGDHPPHHYRVTRDPIPADAVLVNVRYAWPHCSEFLLESSEFEPVKDGDEIPLLRPVCES